MEPTTHHTTVFGVCALEMACDAQDGFPEVSYQFRLLDVLGLECLQVVLPWKPQRTMAAVAPASLPLQPQVSCGSMQGSEDRCPQSALPSLRLGWGALWSPGGKEPLGSAPAAVLTEEQGGDAGLPPLGPATHNLQGGSSRG